MRGILTDFLDRDLSTGSMRAIIYMAVLISMIFVSDFFARPMSYLKSRCERWKIGLPISVIGTLIVLAIIAVAVTGAIIFVIMNVARHLR